MQVLCFSKQSEFDFNYCKIKGSNLKTDIAKMIISILANFAELWLNYDYEKWLFPF